MLFTQGACQLNEKLSRTLVCGGVPNFTQINKWGGVAPVSFALSDAHGF